METYWSRFSDGFDEKQAYTTGIEVIEQVLDKLSKKRSLGAVLELGCGNGRYTRSIVLEAQSIVATDYSAEMAAAAGRVLSECKNVTVEQADCHALQYPDASFDTVLMANVIHVIDGPDAVIKEISRVLKPGGTMLLTCFTIEGMSFLNKLSLLYRYKKTFGAFPKHRTSFTSASLLALVESAGFIVREVAVLGGKTRSIFLDAARG